MTTPNAPTDPDQQPDSLAPEASEHAEEKDTSDFALGIFRMAVVAPGLIVAKVSYDLVPFLPQWAEYVLFAGGSFVLGNVLISGLVALGKRAANQQK